MTYQRVEELSRRWQQRGVFEPLHSALDQIGFSERYVSEVVSLGAQPDAPTKNKVIKDNVWGMIDVEQSCLRLLDCPILQRMRGIKQLGFSYLTYPSAEHTRFVHSLGMFCVVSRFLDTIKRRRRETDRPSEPFRTWTLDPVTERLLNHAAILHDIGHMPFSHVTENIMESDSELFRCGPVSVNEFTFSAEDLLGKEMHFSECISLAIILTPRFYRFYHGWVDRTATSDAIFKIGAMIAGVPPEEGMHGIAGLISGPSIDADKVDYINRDALACGIPIGIDVARLFLRSAFLAVPPAEMRRLTGSDLLPATDQIIFVVNASGLDSIEEIGQARTTLYHRVYLHQTTRSAERLLALALHAAAEGSRTNFDARDALQVWTCEDLGLLEILRKSTDETVSELGNIIRNRRLPKRAAAFGRNFVRMSFPVSDVFPHMQPEMRKRLSKEITGSGLDKLRTKQLVGTQHRQFEREIADEAALIATSIKAGAGQSPGIRPGLVTVLPMPNLEPNRSDCLVLENERLSSTAASSISDEQMEAADIAKSTGYVMTSDEWREIVFVATRSVLYRRSAGLSEVALTSYSGGPQITVKARPHILLDTEAVVRRVGLDSWSLSQIMTTADKGGYFVRYPRLAQSDLPTEELQSAARQLRDFNGQGDWSVTCESVRAFVEQFPPRFRRDIIALIKSFDILDRATLVSTIRAEALKLPETTGRRFFVGLSPDSGSAVRMRLEHELRESGKEMNWIFKKSIRDVFDDVHDNDELIFCDDNATSGTQVVCQYLAWLEIPESNWTEDQRREQGIERAPLSKRDQILIRSLPTYLLTATGTTVAKTYVDEQLRAHGVLQFRGLRYGTEMSRHTTSLGDVSAVLADIGSQLIAWTRYNQSDFQKLLPIQQEECRRDALGYAGASSLVCTPTNVPVGTITAFWCPGLFNGEVWAPLLIRRGYLKHLILS